MATDKTFDFGALTVETAETIPGVKRGRRASVESPFVPVMRESYENGGAGRKLTIPAAHVKDATYLLRQAAAQVGCGATIRVTNKTGDVLTGAEIDKLNPRTNVNVIFAGVEKRKHDPEKRAANAVARERIAHEQFGKAYKGLDDEQKKAVRKAVAADQK